MVLRNAELAIREYELNRGTESEAKALENMQNVLRGGEG